MWLGDAALAQDVGERREDMLRTINDYAESVPIETVRQDGLDKDVLEAMRAVPRHEFVPEGMREHAYADRPLPIGHGQTISQPFIVALMSHLLKVEAGDKVLELGTGSGYQAAVLAEMGLQVASIEIIPELAEDAAADLERAGYGDVATRTGDGYYGWPERAPFDGIVVTAAASHIPPPLVRQLKPGAHMVIPVGSPFAAQQLVLVEKLPDGGTRTRQLLPVRFVPLTGDH
ncbi:MAG: protein-L-isoaspartate(D-aspartate) O-methyltransferase [Rhodovibrionaceae bacterium]|nr:protein-L-isoaspartate(D-aspartate) O-methyltransferase [Rhodovibrionaceae bacterium]